MEEALHVVPLLRQFAGLGSFEDMKLIESTILHFRHFLEQNELAVAIFAEVNVVLSKKGASMKHGSVVDATLIAAPSFSKNPKGNEFTELQKKSSRILSAIRAVAEHPFRVIKQQFSFTKVRYRGLKKNTGKIMTLFALFKFVDGTSRLMLTTSEVQP